MRSDKVKGIIYTLFIGLLLFTSTITLAAGKDIDITTSLLIEGEGVTYRVLEAESEDGLNGLKYKEEWITPGLGYHGNTTLQYEEFLFLSIGNASYLAVEATTTYTNLEHLTCAKNYMLGAAQGHSQKGNASLSLIYQADNMTSAFLGTGGIAGKTIFQFSATDYKNSTKLYKDHITHIGSANITVENVVMQPDYPAAGEEDWMECP